MVGAQSHIVSYAKSGTSHPDRERGLERVIGSARRKGGVWEDRSPHKSGFLTINGVKLHYLDWGGQGQTVLFLHGFGSTPHMYDNLAPKFTNQFQVLGLTRRGHGESEIPPAGYDTATRVEDIREFLNALNISRVILAGHSLAGGELTMFAGKYPERTAKLVYLDAVYDHQWRLELLPQAPPEFFPTATDSKSLESSRRWQKRMNNGWSEASEANLRVHWSADGKTFLNAEKRSKAMESILEAAAEAHRDYKTIKSPVLSISVVGFPSNMVNYFKTLPEGRRKAIDEFLSRFTATTLKEMERFEKELPSARVAVLTNADHDCFIERESDVTREMRTFLVPPPLSSTS